MNKERTVRVPFGILNIGGLAKTKPIIDVDDVVGGEIVTPFFCHESFRIKPTFGRHLDKSFALMENGQHYQRKFRRMVLWDFGDGHKEEGYSVEHHYKKAGYYNISCTFYDINRRAWKNTYYISVVVKEPIPTELRFVDNTTKDTIKCSKIERITRLEALLSATCNSDLNVKALRVFSEQEEDSGYEEVGRNYFEVPSEILKFTRKQWTFLENKQEMIYNSDKIYKENLSPTKLFTPQYQTLYGRFEYTKNSEEPIVLSIYQVIPYKNVDEELKTIRVLNPNCKIDDILSHRGDWQDYKSKFTELIEIKQKYTIDDLPSDVTPIGKRALVDVFYKNDYLTRENHDNVFSFSYDVESVNVTGELESSDNYLNLMPLGSKLRVTQNDLNNVKIGVSLDCFLRKCDESKEFTVDEFLLKTLMTGIDLDFYVFPYIEYNLNEELIEGFVGYRDDEDEDFQNTDTMYYIPKDCSITDVVPEQISTELINSTFDVYNSQIGKDGIESWLSRVRFNLFDEFVFNLCVKVANDSNKEKQIDIGFDERKLINPDEIEIPKEHTVKEDIKQLVDVYMSHPMFDECESIKEFFQTILSGQNMINYTLTRSNNFLNDYAYVKTCYLSNLISTLKMMGEEILEYEKQAFDGVNDLRDFVRILSMNHSDLVGHVISKIPDIKINNFGKGQNVSDKILLSDVLEIKNGKILTLTRDGKTYDYTIWDEKGVEVIIHDRYTNDTKIANFGLCKDVQTISIADYRSSWGWNLLLPSKFDDCEFKLDEQVKSNIYGRSDLERIKLSMRQLIDGYYDFYILDPFVGRKRIGNYLDDASITDRINDPNLWDEEWGIKHEILMKIFRDNGDFKHSKTVIEENLNDGGSTYKLRRIVDMNGTWGEVDDVLSITGNVYKDTLYDDEAKFYGKLQVIGIIYGEGEQFLEMQLVDCSINGEKVYTDEDLLQFQVILKSNDEIQSTKQLFNLNSQSYQGQLSVKLCGKLKRKNDKLVGMLWDVSADLFSKINN